MNTLAVFCGSSNGASEVYRQGAIALGQELAKRKITLVYGGASVGLMGAVADAVLEAGGKAIGVLPRFMEPREVSHLGLTELIYVESMHERKAKMEQLAEGFIVLPGGAGTMEEFFEIFTWAQLGLHQKPFGLLNIANYYDPLVAFFNHMADQQFLQEKFRSMTMVDTTAAGLIDQLHTYQPPSVKTFLTEQQT